MGTLALELGDDHDRHHHLVLLETQQRERIGEQHAGVEDEGAVVVGNSHVGVPL
jgi:hypothetical protein